MVIISYIDELLYMYFRNCMSLYVIFEILFILLLVILVIYKCSKLMMSMVKFIMVKVFR